MFKQPRVPMIKENTRLYDYIRELALFLKDFCLEVWAASKRQEEEIGKLRKTVETLSEKTSE